MNEIANTGFWNGETAHNHHVHSDNLSQWIYDFCIKKKIQSVTDFGCGLGEYLSKLSPIVSNAIGVEGSIPKQAKFEYIIQGDLTTDLKSKAFTSDLVISLEVGEHIPAEFMKAYLDNITSHAKTYLITSWAVRGQAGFGHVNCLDNSEIVPEFEKRGFKLLEKETEKARLVIEDKAHWFRNTLFIFKNNALKA
jgi:cyclopropane fatty-acyl-phospholipid synthase-like methyltransferase